MPADAKSPKKPRNNRAALTHMTGHTLRHPDHVGLDTGNRIRAGRPPLPTA
ncbi:hypothetical protein [Streptomyces sp. NPDC002588]|uniref:hypothetical protein n=1 Tax=Streptomyces sp. NPDC002588 TaxID=3154419 RepID=UPI003317D1F9